MKKLHELKYIFYLLLRILGLFKGVINVVLKSDIGTKKVGFLLLSFLVSCLDLELRHISDTISKIDTFLGAIMIFCCYKNNNNLYQYRILYFFTIF